jgi:hypothetical protein
VGAPPLQRGRDGVQLTEAGSVPLEESRAVLSRIDYGVSRARQAAGLTRPRLRFVVPPSVPEDLVIDVASRLRRTAAAAEVDVAWIEAPLDGEFAPAHRRPDRPASSYRRLARSGGALSGGRVRRPGSRPDRRISAGRHGGPGVGRRPAPPAPAGALRHRRQHRLLTRSPPSPFSPWSSGGLCAPHNRHPRRGPARPMIGTRRGGSVGRLIKGRG